MMVKVSKYSIKSEAAIRGRTIKKAILKSFKNVTEKNLCLNLYLNKVAGPCTRVYL